MARGRWSRDSDGWETRRGRSRDRSSSRAGGGRWDRRQGGNAGDEDAAHKLREARRENERLQRELKQAKRDGQGQRSRPTFNANAKEGQPRDGDWECAICYFRTNRHAREACFRCGAPKASSFPAGSAHARPAATAAGSATTTSPATWASRLVAAAIPPVLAPGGGGCGGGGGGGATVAASPIHLSHHIPGGGVPVQTAAAQLPGASAALSSQTAPAGTGEGKQGAAAPPVGSSPTGGGGTQPAGPEAVKALKAKLDSLLESRAGLATNAFCGEALAVLDQSIVTTRAQLASIQPMEVALRGTLGAVTQAKQALQKAESKAAKLEAQVVSAITAFDAATAEVESCKRQLVEAEAATARAAGAHLDIYSVLAVDPGVAFAAFKAAAAARCAPGSAGVSPEVVARAEAAFREMQAVCALLPSQAPQASHSPQPAQQDVAGQPPSSATQLPSPAAQHQSSSTPPTATTTTTTTITSLLAPSSPSVPSQFEATVAAAHAAQAAATAMSEGVGGGSVGGIGQPVPSEAGSPPTSTLPTTDGEGRADDDGRREAVPPTPVPPEATALQEVVPQLQAEAALALQRQRAEAELEAARFQSQQASAAAAQARAQEQQLLSSATSTAAAAAAAAPVVQVGAVEAAGAAMGTVVPVRHDDGHGSTVGPTPSDDTMGGAAPTSVVGKRSLVDAARAVAAKAKARAA